MYFCLTNIIQKLTAMVCPPYILIYMVNISAVAQSTLQLQQHYKLHHAKQDALSLDLNA
jgi:hypothetical protein